MALRLFKGSLLAGLLALVASAGTVAAQGAAITVDPAQAKRGQSFFTSRGCVGCHTVGGGKRAGPDLAGVLQRRDTDWVRRFVKNPTAMFETDSIAKALLAQHNNTKMPNLRLKDDEVEALLHYIQQESQKAARTSQ